ncbi:hypothetical protein [Consotaella aegiceratis]|uniref:hypothetical protein n=1 Tax=Consotaella aegiceratis TaxID=3097961 RepID=UPI002F41794C
MSAAMLTVTVEDPLLTEGGTVVVLVTKIDQQTFDERHGDAVIVKDNAIQLQATVNSVVSFLEVDAPPGFEYRFQTKDGRPIAEQRVSVGEGGGYRDITTGQYATADITFHHYIKGPHAELANSRALDGSYFRIDPADCKIAPAVRICSGSAEALAEMIRDFDRSETH